MKISSIYSALGSALLVAGLASAANATPVVWSGASAPSGTIVGTPIENNPITDRFSGRASVSKTCFFVPINLTCTLQLDGTISASGSDVRLDITDGESLGPTSGGAGLISCNDVSFTNFNWTSEIDESVLPADYTDTTPAPFTVAGVQVNTICGDCSGSVDASFRNQGRGEFSFDGTLPGTIGNCAVSGVLDSAPTADSTGGSGNYYRVWTE